MITIERFRSSDAERFLQARQIRDEVFVVEQNVPEALEYEHDDEAENYLLLEDGVVKATARWRETGGGIKLERFAVPLRYRSSGYGTILLERILGDVLPMNRRTYLHSQVTAVNYYLKAGFALEGEPFFEAGIEHRLMVYPGSQG